MCVRAAVAFCLLAGAAAAAEPAVLRLADGSHLAGAPHNSDDRTALRWQSPSFARPLEFPLASVNAAHFPLPPAPPSPADEFCFELADDDAVYGRLAALTDDAVEIEHSALGRLHVRRDRVRRVYRWKGADTVYHGPNGLAGWKDASAVPQWRDEGGQLFTDRPGAQLFADVSLPAKAAVEFDLSWKGKPDFILALGVGEAGGADRYAFRFAVWEGQLVVVGESPKNADVAVVQPAGAAGGQARVQVYVDQAERRLTLLSRGGKVLAAMNIGGPARPLPGVRLTNVKGDVRLEYLRVARWNGMQPPDVRDDRSRVHRADGSVVYGRLAGYDPGARRFTVRDGESEAAVPHDAVTDIFLAPAGQPADPERPLALRVVYRDGSRFSGALAGIDGGRLTLECPGVRDALRLTLADVRALIPLKREAAPPPAGGRAGRLEAEGVSLKGRLVGDGDHPAAGLLWHPDLARSPAPLAAGLSGRIVYRDPPPPPKPTPRQTGVVIGGGNIVFNAVGGRVQAVQPQQPPAVKSPSRGVRSLHLRSGDTLPVTVTRIDEKGVTFTTPYADAKFVAHEKVKGVELIPTFDAPSLDEAKRDRLLTLPRMQRDSPPTHLICSRNGDFLRGRIVEMDEHRLKVEVRLEVKDVPRDRVAQIIWLHADELGDKKPAADAPPGGNRETRAQSLDKDGNRMTFVVEKSDATRVWGTSDVLGACRATLADVDQLFFGSQIEESASRLAYHTWKLHHAAEPKFVTAGGGSGDGGQTGLESALVGQPAPAVQLDMLDGSRFKLADRKGRVVVLEFWATWCGPCLQSMPAVHEIAREFADKNVDLVAVNMEEQAAQVKSMLERHKMTMPVALDRDGAAAAKYAVESIPHTVVIDREGKVARVFVGGGKGTTESLRKALAEIAPK